MVLASNDLWGDGGERWGRSWKQQALLGVVVVAGMYLHRWVRDG